MYPSDRKYTMDFIWLRVEGASASLGLTVGKDTPVRYEAGQQEASGQEENRVHLCTLSQ
jgi:hypothetical protein